MENRQTSLHMHTRVGRSGADKAPLGGLVCMRRSGGAGAGAGGIVGGGALGGGGGAGGATLGLQCTHEQRGNAPGKLGCTRKQPRDDHRKEAASTESRA